MEHINTIISKYANNDFIVSKNDDAEKVKLLINNNMLLCETKNIHNLLERYIEIDNHSVIEFLCNYIISEGKILANNKNNSKYLLLLYKLLGYDNDSDLFLKRMLFRILAKQDGVHGKYEKNYKTADLILKYMRIDDCLESINKEYSLGLIMLQIDYEVLKILLDNNVSLDLFKFYSCLNNFCFNMSVDAIHLYITYKAKELNMTNLVSNVMNYYVMKNLNYLSGKKEIKCNIINYLIKHKIVLTDYTINKVTKNIYKTDRDIIKLFSKYLRKICGIRNFIKFEILEFFCNN